MPSTAFYFFKAKLTLFPIAKALPGQFKRRRGLKRPHMHYGYFLAMVSKKFIIFLPFILENQYKVLHDVAKKYISSCVQYYSQLFFIS